MKKDLSVKEEGMLSMTTDNRPGFEVPSQQEDLELPRAKLFHGLPTEFIDFPDAKPGQILNNLTKEQLPSEFIPIIRAVEWIRFNPQRKEDPGFDPNYDTGALIWRSTNPEDPRVRSEGAWGPNGEPPLATKFLSFLSYFPGVQMPVIVSFAKTSFKAGKNLNTLLTFSTGPMWSLKFKLTSRLNTSGGLSYYVYVVSGAGKPTETEATVCAALYSNFKHKSIEAAAEVEPEKFE